MIPHPFPHLIIDDFLSLDTVRRINEEWPQDEHAWNNHHHKHSKKRLCSDLQYMGERTQAVWRDLHDVERFIKLTGIGNLLPDRTGRGEGLHETLPGGFLDIHVDFNVHPVTKFYRRVNLLVYLNEDWKEEWNGALELWDYQTCKPSVKIEPIAGRAVLFETSAISFHGHPHPLACPEGRSRRSIGLYYYAPTPPKHQLTIAEHSTMYLEKVQ